MFKSVVFLSHQVGYGVLDHLDSGRVLLHRGSRFFVSIDPANL